MAIRENEYTQQAFFFDSRKQIHAKIVHLRYFKN